MANHPLMKDVKNWILDSFSFMDGIGYDIQFEDDIFGMENTKAFSIDIDGLTDYDFEKGKENLIKSVPKKIKAEFPYLRISSTRDGNYFVMFITLLDNNDYLEDTKLTYINLNESKKSTRKSLKEGISAFNKAIAKKYNETEPNSAGQYYLDWRFDLHDEKDNIEAIADRCGVTVEFQTDEGYFEVFEESKKSVRKSLKEEAITTKLFRFIQDLYDVHYITEEQLNKFQKHDFSKKEIKVLEQNYEIYKTSNEFDEINNAIKSTVNMINSFKESLKESSNIKENIWVWQSLLNHVCNFTDWICTTFSRGEDLHDVLERQFKDKEITLDEFVDASIKFMREDFFTDDLLNFIKEYLPNDEKIKKALKVYGLSNKYSEKKSIKESVEFYNDFGTGVYCATSSNGWTFCYCPLSWINKKGVEDLIGWSVMDDKAHYIDGDSWENKTDEEINDSIDNFEKLIKKYAKEDAKEIIKDFRSTLEK